MTAAAMDAIELLTSQHRRLEALLKTVLDSREPGARAEQLAQAGDELAVHISAEEAVFYPAVHAARTEDILLESLEEHLSLKRLLADLLALAPDDETFEPKCKVLSEQAEHHHGEEEENLFPKVRKLLHASQRLELGRQMQEHQALLRSQGRPRDAVKAQTTAAEPLT